jgi:hypothetical protein
MNERVRLAELLRELPLRKARLLAPVAQ